MTGRELREALHYIIEEKNEAFHEAAKAALNYCKARKNGDVSGMNTYSVAFLESYEDGENFSKMQNVLSWEGSFIEEDE